MDLKHLVSPIFICALVACGGEGVGTPASETSASETSVSETSASDTAVSEEVLVDSATVEQPKIVEVISNPAPLQVVDFEGIPYVQLVEADTDFPAHDPSLDFVQQIELLNTEFERVLSVFYSNGAALSTTISMGNLTSGNAIVDSEHQRMLGFYQSCFDSNSAFDISAIAYKFCGAVYHPIDDGFVLTHIGEERNKFAIFFTSFNEEGNAVGWGVNVHDDDSLSVDYLPPTSNGGAFRCLTQNIESGDFNTKKFCATLLEGAIKTLELL